MKSYSAIHSRAVLATVCGIAFVLSITAVPAQADDWNKKTTLTVNRTVDVSDTVLQPGQYVLRLLDSSSDRHIVQIFNGDQSHLMATILTYPAERETATGGDKFTFREIPGKAAMAMDKWFYPGDLIGQQFPYPKHTAILEAAVSNPPAAPAPAVPATTEPPGVSEVVPPVTEPAMAQPDNSSNNKSDANAGQPDDADQQTDVDQPQDQTPAVSQATTPQAQPTDSTPSNSASDSTPAEMPKTASPYPPIGLFGLLSLGLYGLVRRKKQAA